MECGSGGISSALLLAVNYGYGKYHLIILDNRVFGWLVEGQVHPDPFIAQRDEIAADGRVACPSIHTGENQCIITRQTCRNLEEIDRADVSSEYRMVPKLQKVGYRSPIGICGGALMRAHTFRSKQGPGFHYETLRVSKSHKKFWKL